MFMLSEFPLRESSLQRFGLLAIVAHCQGVSSQGFQQSGNRQMCYRNRRGLSMNGVGSPNRTAMEIPRNCPILNVLSVLVVSLLPRLWCYTLGHALLVEPYIDAATRGFPGASQSWSKGHTFTDKNQVRLLGSDLSGEGPAMA